MKSLFFIFVFSLLMLPFYSYSQIKVNSAGKVGINNTNPSYQLDVNGNLRMSGSSTDIIFDGNNLYPTNDYSLLGTTGNKWCKIYAQEIYAYSYISYSDKNLKMDIKDIELTKDKILTLRPVKYKFKPEIKTDSIGNILTNPTPEVEQIGFIAQEMQKVFPEIVVEDKNGTLGIQYTALIPVLVKALQEQQAEIDDLKSRIEKLESAIKSK